MNKGLLTAFAVCMLLSESILAQTPQFMTSGTWGTVNQPFTQATGHRVQWLLHPADFTQPPPPGMISRIYLLSATTVTSPAPVFQHLAVRMGMTNQQVLTTPWVVPPDTIFYSPAHTFTGGVTQNQWVELTLQTPFYYDGVSGLLVDAVQAGAANGFSIYQDNTYAGRRIQGAPGAAAGSVAPGMLAFGFDRGSVSANNAAAMEVTEPVLFCQGSHDVKVKVMNTGSNRIDSVQVHWELDGVPQQPVTWRTAIDTTGSAGGNSAVVTLGNVSFGLAPRSVKAWTVLPNGLPDPFNPDDTTAAVLSSALSGPYTIGGTAPDFQTLAEAAAALNIRGVCGPVVMNIRDGSYTGQQAVVNAIRGASQANRITFKSESNDTSKVSFTFQATSTTDNYILKLPDVSYVTIRDLTFRTTSTTDCRAIELAGVASYDSIYNCVFEMTPGGSNDRKAAVYGNNLTGVYNVVRNNVFREGGTGIHWNGLNGTRCYNHIIDSNTFVNQGIRGIDVIYSGNMKITGNVITRTGGSGTFYGLEYEQGDSLMEITGNSFVIDTPAGAAYGMRFASVTGTAQARHLISGNRIAISRATGISRGISWETGTAYADIINNTVAVHNASTSAGSTTAPTTSGIYAVGTNLRCYHNSVRVTGSTTTYAGYFSGTMTAVNNVFYNAGTTGAGVFINNPATVIQLSDYNNVYSVNGNTFYKSNNPSGNHSLSSWRSGFGHELHSISYPPAFLDTFTLAPDPAAPAVWAIHGRGDHIGVPTDINGNPRPPVRAAGVPDLGAYEFTATAVPPAADADAAPAAGTTQVFTFGGDTVARITWAASSNVPASVTVRPYPGVLPPGLGAGRYMYFYTDIAAPAGTYNYTVNVHYKEPWRGVMDLEGDIRLAKKNSSVPWFLYGGTASSVDVNANVITAAGLTDFSLFTGTDALVSPACAGVPQQADITNTPLPLCSGDSLQLTATDPNEQSGVSGLAYQWQQATVTAGPWSNVTGGTGATTLGYTTPALSATTYYRLRVTCTASTQVSYSDTFTVTVLQPQPVTVTPGSHCGPGTVMLEAAGMAPVIWYNAATGGQALDTGATYTTPHLTTTTTYYVQAGNHCGARTPVTATVHTLPDADIATTGSTTFCSGGNVMLTSGNVYDGYRWQRDGAAIPGATQQSYTASDAGAYRLIVTDANGCTDTSAPVTVTVYPSPQPEISFDGTGLSTTIAYAAYQWHRDGADIPGATSREHTPEANGAYTVTVDDDQGCYATSAPYHFNVGIPSAPGVAAAIRIYPNPVQDGLRIEAPVPVHITLGTADGKTVLRQENAQWIDTRSLPAGVYIMRITDTGNILLRTERVTKLQQ